MSNICEIHICTADVDKSEERSQQLVEHRTDIAEVMGSNPVEALIFSGFFLPIA